MTQLFEGWDVPFTKDGKPFPTKGYHQTFTHLEIYENGVLVERIPNEQLRTSEDEE